MSNHIHIWKSVEPYLPGKLGNHAPQQPSVNNGGHSGAYGRPAA